MGQLAGPPLLSSVPSNLSLSVSLSLSLGAQGGLHPHLQKMRSCTHTRTHAHTHTHKCIHVQTRERAREREGGEREHVGQIAREICHKSSTYCNKRAVWQQKTWSVAGVLANVAAEERGTFCENTRKHALSQSAVHLAQRAQPVYAPLDLRVP